MGKHALVRVVDVPEAVVYGATTVVAGGATVAFGAASVVLLVAIPISLGTSIIPLAITLPLMFGSYATTTYSGSKTQHKIQVACGSEKHCHSLAHVKKAFGK